MKSFAVSAFEACSCVASQTALVMQSWSGVAAGQQCDSNSDVAAAVQRCGSVLGQQGRSTCQAVTRVANNGSNGSSTSAMNAAVPKLAAPMSQ